VAIASADNLNKDTNDQSLKEEECEIISDMLKIIEENSSISMSQGKVNSSI